MTDVEKKAEAVTVVMGLQMVIAANFVLQSTRIVGRSAMRNHKRIFNALVKQCADENKVPKESALSLPTEDWDTIHDYCEEVIKAGFPSQFNDGLLDLAESIEKAMPVEPEK